jgi:plastocyanin domain-containing protein
MSTLLVNIAGVLVAGLIVWWFWFSKPHTVRRAGREPLDIIVADGVYTPSSVQAVVGETIRLRFIRKDPSPCAEKVIFSDFNVSADLELNTPHEISLSPNSAGEFEFTCQMGMYRGQIVVR